MEKGLLICAKVGRDEGYLKALATYFLKDGH